MIIIISIIGFLIVWMGSLFLLNYLAEKTGLELIIHFGALSFVITFVFTILVMMYLYDLYPIIIHFIEDGCFPTGGRFIRKCL